MSLNNQIQDTVIKREQFKIISSKYFDRLQELVDEIKTEYTL